MQLKIDHFAALSNIKNSFNESLEDVRLELDEHLDSINQNSVEIQANYEYLEELNKKIDKLTNRLDELGTLFLHSMAVQDQKATFTDQEKEVFVVLYTAQEPLSYEEIAARSALPLYLVEDIVMSMKLKHIPINKKIFAGKTLLVMDDKFKEAQKKFNLVKVNANVLSTWC